MKSLILGLVLSAQVFAHGNIVCSDGVDFHSSTTITVDAHAQEVKMVVNGEEENYILSNIDYFAKGVVKVTFYAEELGTPYTLDIVFNGREGEGSLNKSSDKFSCYQ